jgi:methionyl-tRNA formyltransferase
MRIVFFGTPEFAVPSLRSLLDRRNEIVAVVTQPDRPQGRSRTTLVPPPVKRAAIDAGLPLLQPERPVGDLFMASLRHLRAELGVVVAYGHILRPEVLSIPPLGMINVHASLLPRYRGAAPIPWVILNGETETGISIMRMDAGLDTGRVLQQVRTPIAPDDTGGSLTDRLADLGAKAAADVVGRLAKGEVPGESQDHSDATYAPKVDRETTRLSFAGPALAAARKVRAFDPNPGAWAMHDDFPVKLFGGRVVTGQGEPGQVLAAGRRTIVIACGDDALEVLEVQPAGKTRITVDAWVRGRGVAVGDRFT